MTMPQEILYTLEDTFSWDEKERTELIYGSPRMLAAPLRIHQEICREIILQLGNYLKGKKCSVYSAPFAVRPFEQKGDLPRHVDTVVQPDITVVCDPDKLDDIGCQGAPDLIMEILSPSTERYDRLVKFNLYARAGVREYWIIDPQAKTALSYFLEDGHYIPKEFGTAADKMPVTILENCILDLSQIFAD